MVIVRAGNSGKHTTRKERNHFERTMPYCSRLGTLGHCHGACSPWKLPGPLREKALPRNRRPSTHDAPETLGPPGVCTNTHFGRSIPPPSYFCSPSRCCHCSHPLSLPLDPRCACVRLPRRHPTNTSITHLPGPLDYARLLPNLSDPSEW